QGREAEKSKRMNARTIEQRRSLPQAQISPLRSARARLTPVEMTITGMSDVGASLPSQKPLRLPCAHHLIDAFTVASKLRFPAGFLPEAIRRGDRRGCRKLGGELPADEPRQPERNTSRWWRSEPLG